MRPAGWVEVANATNDTATATRAATTNGGRHNVLHVAASFSASTSSALLTITMGSVVVTHYVHGADIVPLDLRVAADTAVTAALATGGAGVVGRVALVGDTEP